ncbi:LysR family transcriptional regulator [Paraglaciecola agarilytica]|jgi:DNA-binding transcriptional LysR family regulator|uniref:LysR family transcriptional regulator n=1 Tax=Paraglaciecola chathamensis TaxID=368405 RepID=A0A8H9M3A4_9ALTE|nr:MULTISPECIES: LysR family transcriptional regulator [Paraglaciecola]MBJ2138805.1 LysR family transcriptional regulator [Paraglaciecola chathamensis]MBU3019019.1 LysR family transcriptional regulator [Paraglaciecola agarilytica]MDO6557988.1 LysR family transcriptional regulator [Paraglaciecola chathamensis]GGZ53368.1 LysR family transcriptional regulator [Paraglaciecola oceanifecundans]
MADMHALKKLDLNLLKVFESLYVEQNMTRTADALHITPSAVSHSIKRLRECLGDPLFQRSNNRMLPTPACQRMAPLIIDNLTRLRQIMQHWGEFQPLTSEHHFRIGMHYALEPSILPALTTRLASLAPNVTFSSVKVDRVTLTRDLSAGHMDLALDVALPIKSPVLHQKLIDDDFCVLMRSEHPLTENMSKDAYFAAGHIGVSNRSSGASVEDLLFQQQGLSRKVVIRCQNYYSAKSMAANSDNLLTVPRRLAEHLRQDDVALFDLPISIAPISTHMYWHKNTEQDSALTWLRALFDGIFVG